MRARHGFMLIEAVVALAIIGLVSIALLATTAAQVRTAGKAQRLLTARALAEERLAMLRSLHWQDLLDVPDSLADGTFPPPFEAYTWQAEVTPTDDEYELYTATVVVNVGDEAFPLVTLLHEPQTAGAGEGGAAAGLSREGFFGGTVSPPARGGGSR
ncbi:MAG: type II secretion system protein [Gemmatimonadota bacterium]